MPAAMKARMNEAVVARRLALAAIGRKLFPF
jgi:hypothetical protein